MVVAQTLANGVMLAHLALPPKVSFHCWLGRPFAYEDNKLGRAVSL